MRSDSLKYEPDAQYQEIDLKKTTGYTCLSYFRNLSSRDDSGSCTHVTYDIKLLYSRFLKLSQTRANNSDASYACVRISPTRPCAHSRSILPPLSSLDYLRSLVNKKEMEAEASTSSGAMEQRKIDALKGYRNVSRLTVATALIRSR